MGYSAGENPLSYPEIKYAMVCLLYTSGAEDVEGHRSGIIRRQVGILPQGDRGNDIGIDPVLHIGGFNIPTGTQNNSDIINTLGVGIVWFDEARPRGILKPPMWSTG